MFTKLLIINNKCGGGKNDSHWETTFSAKLSFQAGKHVDTLLEAVKLLRNWVNCAAKRLSPFILWPAGSVRLASDSCPNLTEIRFERILAVFLAKMLTRGTLQRCMGSLIQPPLESCVDCLRRAPWRPSRRQNLATIPIPNHDPDPNYPATSFTNAEFATNPDLAAKRSSKGVLRTQLRMNA